MKSPIKERAFTTGMIVLATVVVIVLAALQYRWSDQISEATSTRLADSLQMSMINWHLDFFRDFSEVCVALRVDPEVDAKADWNQYATRFAEWKETTAHPDLVSNVYVLSFDKSPDPKVLSLDAARQEFEPVTFPNNLDALRQELREAPSRIVIPIPAIETDDAYQQPDQDRDFADRYYSGGPLEAWQFEPAIPALVRPIPRQESTGTGLQAAGGQGVDWIVIALNEDAVQDEILPELAQRYFMGTQGLDYQLAVVAGHEPQRVLYSSDPPFGEKQVVDADGTMNIFGRVQDKLLGSPIHVFHTPSENKGPAASVGISWFPLVHEQGEDLDWRLILRHRRGGALGAFVADSRRRNLMISFGVLFLLVISIAILVITSARAQRLAQLQMDFVTAVSHELRTPLTVISSAAENISQGIVDRKDQMEQYGNVISRQAKKLFEMVEQILLFASIREGHQRYSLRPVKVSDIVEAAVSGTGGLIQTAGFEVDRNVESNLPQVLGDLSALSQCLQNLITNALKYSNGQRWIGIRAGLADHGLGGREIQISVSDHGMGIDAREIQHIFEPFYRTSSVTAAQIHGTGLGLPLAKSIVEAMKGQISVESALGRGSTFTLHLPILEHPIRQPGAKTTEAITS